MIYYGFLQAVVRQKHTWVYPHSYWDLDVCVPNITVQDKIERALELAYYHVTHYGYSQYNNFEESIYFHTHKFLLQYHYITPVPPNDFAQWAITSLNDDLLGERLSSIDVVRYDSLTALKESIIKVVEEHVSENGSRRECPPGEEFHFMASQAFIIPTPIVVRTLEEFAAHLEHVSLNSLYHHMFDARLRLGRGENDFSAWFRGIGKEGLAEEVQKLDPYLHTLEGLRKRLEVLVRRHA